MKGCVFDDGTSRKQDSWVEEMTKYVPILKDDLKDRIEIWNESTNSSSEVTTPKSDAHQFSYRNLDS